MDSLASDKCMGDVPLTEISFPGNIMAIVTVLKVLNVIGPLCSDNPAIATIAI